MVAEPWLLKVSTNLKNALLLEAPRKGNKKQEPKQIIGILSFEVANVMSKTAILHKSLVDSEIVKLKGEIFNSDGIKALVSDNEAYLLELALAEKLDELNRVVEVVSRLGKKCSVPALQGFEHVYGDIVGGVIEVRELGFLVKDMEGMIKKMEKYVSSTANLYGEMEVLGDLEQATKKFQRVQYEESRRVFEQKIAWQKQDVTHLKDVSLWNQTYDKVVELLARTVCTLYVRICQVFGKPVMRGEYASDAISGAQFRSNGSSAHLKEECGVKSGQIDVIFGNSGPIRRALSKTYSYNHSGLMEKGLADKRELNFRPQVAPQRGDMALFQAENNFACGMGPRRLLMECLSLSSSASKVDDNGDDSVGHDDRNSQVSGCCSIASGVKRGNLNQSGCFSRSLQGSVINTPKSGPKSRLMTYAPQSTVGGSALALHYANVVIIIEKLLRYPHLVGEEARDDLYYMLPTSLKSSLKISLKSYIKNLAIFDAPLAHGWKERLDQILKWLAPMAHNMIRWQSERNFEQQQIVTRTNVLLLQTLYFADRAKTEAAICELLIGLNYICRYEHQQNALLDCASSFDFNGDVDWRLQH